MIETFGGAWVTVQRADSRIVLYELRLDTVDDEIDAELEAGKLFARANEKLTLCLMNERLYSQDATLFVSIPYGSSDVSIVGGSAELGVNVEWEQKALVLISSLMARATIAVSGAIGFVGMMVPHVCRMLVGSDHRRVLPLSALIGELLVIWTDVTARMVLAPEELPVGVLTAIIGGPCFIAMLKSKSGRLV